MIMKPMFAEKVMAPKKRLMILRAKSSEVLRKVLSPCWIFSLMGPGKDWCSSCSLNRSC